MVYFPLAAGKYLLFLCTRMVLNIIFPECSQQLPNDICLNNSDILIGPKKDMCS